MAVVEFLASSSVVTTFDNVTIKCYRIQNRDRVSIEALVKVGEEGVGGKAELLPRPFPSRVGAVIGIWEWVTEVSSGHGDRESLLFHISSLWQTGTKALAAWEAPVITSLLLVHRQMDHVMVRSKT